MRGAAARGAAVSRAVGALVGLALLTVTSPADACGAGPAFAVGESLAYDLSWAGIPAGRATLAIESLAEAAGRPVLKLVATASSNKFVDAFYKVRVRAESLFDCEGRYSHHFLHRAQEGRRRREREYTFDLAHQEVRRQQSGDPMLTFPLPEPVQDPFTTLYEVRARPLEVGRSVFLRAFEGTRQWDVEVKVLRRERIKVPAGAFDTIVVKPLLKFEGVFVNKGDIVVWLTDDQRRVPVKMVSEVRIGSIAAELTVLVRPEP